MYRKNLFNKINSFASVKLKLFGFNLHSITNMNSKYLFTYDKGDWLSKDKTDTIDKFIAKKYNILVDKFDELEGKNELDDKIMERFNIFSRNYQDKEAQKITKNDIMLMMYNNKNKVNMK
mgnify:CR=1 FL=1